MRLGLSIEFSLAAIMALVLYFVAGKNNTILNVLLLAALFGFCLHPALNLPWIVNAVPSSIKAWRILAIVALVLVSVVRFGIWVWPAANSEPTAQTSTVRSSTPTDEQVPADVNLNKRPYFGGKAGDGYFFRPGNAGIAEIFIMVQIVNKGIPSSVAGWTLHYQSPSLDKTFRYVLIEDATSFPSEDRSRVKTFYGKDAI